MTQNIPQDSQPKFQLRRRLPLVFSGVAILIGGGVAGYVGLMRWNWQRAMPIGVEVIPVNALMTISVSTNPEQWQQLRSFGTAQSRTVLDQNLVQVRDRLLTANGINYEQDIQPWVGSEMTLAFLTPPNHNSDRNQFGANGSRSINGCGVSNCEPSPGITNPATVPSSAARAVEQPRLSRLSGARTAGRGSPNPDHHRLG